MTHLFPPRLSADREGAPVHPGFEQALHSEHLRGADRGGALLGEDRTECAAQHPLDETRLGLIRHGGRTDEAAVPQHRDGVAELQHFAEEVRDRSEEHTSELQSLMRISYAVFCLKKKNYQYHSFTRILRLR